MDTLTDALRVFLLCNKYYLYFILTGSMIDATIGAPLFVKGFVWKKDEYAAFALKFLYSALYFILLNIFMLYKIYLRDSEYQNFSLFIWFLLLVPSTYLLYNFVDKFQGRAKKKKQRTRKRSASK